MSDHNEPAAWAIQWGGDKEVDCEFVFPAADTAGDVQLENSGSVVVPLYRHQQPTLTDAEREAVEFAVKALGEIFEERVELAGSEHPACGFGIKCGKHSATLRGLLERMK